ncbi:TrkH family potassium uptake protein [Fusobacterium perfoetens]|uniref:TrkH family potassium uptake protein n=1 Tax=Fusobacterium perfoetens TaxID=852 RepID=UPI0026ED1090|nr:TrkH family potassium uptake protein [Fusobacterium perfoetens]
MKKVNFFKRLSLSRKLILGFMVTIIVGTFLLMLPISTTSGEGLDFLTALFTITSAVCVTGLSVIDISKVLSIPGQLFLLIFIQLGGLGIMTFSSFIFLLIKKKITYEEKELLKEERNIENIGGILKFLRKIIITVIIIEGVGAFFLTIKFLEEMPLKEAIYFGIFHSISAFCNAGFSLFTTGLEKYSDSIIINLTIAYLIIIGGLGFGVIDSLIKCIRYKNKKLHLTAKVAILVSCFLTFLGMILFYVFERNNLGTIGNLDLGHQIIASFFQSVTTRTAGFNTVPMGNLQSSSIFLFCILMFIGASPGSTGGGIKTTTIGVLIFYVYSIIKKREHTVIFNRRIDWEVMNRAIAILIISLMYVIIIIIMIMLTIENFKPEDIIFEVVSAFGTVGLSVGITPNLGVISKILIICTMFLGRLGPMTFALAFGGTKKIEKIIYPKENIIVG